MLLYRPRRDNHFAGDSPGEVGVDTAAAGPDHQVDQAAAYPSALAQHKAEDARGAWLAQRERRRNTKTGGGREPAIIRRLTGQRQR